MSNSIFGYQVIQTKFIPASTTKGPRIKAQTTSGLTASIPYEYGANSVADAHWLAAKTLISKHALDWGNKFAVGASIDDKGYIFTPIRHEDNFATLED